jgi:hypothetical protein
MTKLRLPIDGVFIFMEEIFKEIPGYEGVYQVSNLGRVKSLPRKVCNHQGCHISKEKILKAGLSRKYLSVVLSDKISSKAFKVHQLVAMAFLNHTRCGMRLVVDHINNNQSDNRLENLQLISSRENSSKDVKNKTSKYTGVSWCKVKKKWVTRFKINGKYLHLGYFKCELTASVAYQNKLKETLC